MNRFHRHRPTLRLLTLAGAALFTAGSFAASEPVSPAQVRYQQDRAACMSGHTYEDRATCLKEAGAAYDEARRGQLTDNSTDYQRNALKRCNNLPQKDRADCVARMEGRDTTVSGSVGGGGELRERVTAEIVRRQVPPPPTRDSAQ